METTQLMDKNLKKYMNSNNVTTIPEYAKNGMGILVSTHSLDVAEELADKILIIDKGKIIKNTSLREIKEDKNFKSLEDLFISITDKNL